MKAKRQNTALWAKNTCNYTHTQQRTEQMLQLCMQFSRTPIKIPSLKPLRGPRGGCFGKLWSFQTKCMLKHVFVGRCAFACSNKCMCLQCKSKLIPEHNQSADSSEPRACQLETSSNVANINRA